MKIKCKICGYQTHRLAKTHFRIHNITKCDFKIIWDLYEINSEKFLRKNRLV